MFRPVSQRQRPNSFKSFTNATGQAPSEMTNHDRITPAFVNIKEVDDHFLISLAIPGFTKSDIEIKLDKNILTVQGKQEATNDIKFLKREFITNEFTRSFTLPEDINVDTISATFDQGILNVTVPKGEKIQPKKIEII